MSEEDQVLESLDAILAEMAKDETPDEQPSSQSQSETETDQDSFWRGNPNELDENLKPIYKSMQADHTRSKQEIAREREQLQELYGQIQDGLKQLQEQGSSSTPAGNREQAPVDPVEALRSDYQKLVTYLIQDKVNNLLDQAAKESGVERKQLETVIQKYNLSAEQIPLAAKIIELEGGAVKPKPRSAEDVVPSDSAGHRKPEVKAGMTLWEILQKT